MKPKRLTTEEIKALSSEIEELYNEKARLERLILAVDVQLWNLTKAGIKDLKEREKDCDLRRREEEEYEKTNR